MESSPQHASTPPANRTNNAKGGTMSGSIRLLFLVAVALLGETQLSLAQSAPSFYPWCAVNSGGRGGGGRSCYYTSREQCMTTMSGVGGYCVQNPGYRGSPQGSTGKSRKRRHS